MNETAPGVLDPVPPPGFSKGYSGSTEFVARNDIFEEVRDVLAQYNSLYEWACRQPQHRSLRGRAPVYTATFPVSELKVVVRHAWHGGLFASITRDFFAPPTRAPRELHNSLQLAASGVSTTTVVGFALCRKLHFLRRVDVMSRYIPDAVDLGDVILGRSGEFQLDEIVHALSVILHQLDLAGAVHPDLNAKNILLSRHGKEAVKATVIDVDVIHFAQSPLSPSLQRVNRLRLARSIRKIAAIGRANENVISSAHGRENGQANTRSHRKPVMDSMVQQLIEVCERDR